MVDANLNALGDSSRSHDAFVVEQHHLSNERDSGPCWKLGSVKIQHWPGGTASVHERLRERIEPIQIVHGRVPAIGQPQEHEKERTSGESLKVNGHCRLGAETNPRTCWLEEICGKKRSLRVCGIVLVRVFLGPHGFLIRIG